jgi:nicotinate-nucleotide adenylyltransferase
MSSELVAIYGGTFDPFHMGHIYCLQNILERTNIEKVFVVPAHQNPLKAFVEGPTPQQRVEMVKVGLQDFGDDIVEVDEQEINRGGKSFTIDTVRAYLKDYRPEQLHLVVGLDEFYNLHKWKDFPELLKSCNFLVVSRPGNLLPFSKDDLPEPLREYVDALDRSLIALTTGRTVEFLRVKGLDVAATEIRKYVKTGRSVDKFLDIRVEEYIKKNNIYPLIGPKVGDYKAFTEFCADRLYARKALNLRAMDLGGVSAAASDFVIIASGTSKRHAQSLGEWLVREVKNQFGLNPLSVEGMEEGRWVLIDYGQLIVHIFYDYVRMEYGLENLWKKGVDFNLKDPYEGKNDDDGSSQA